MKLNFTIKLFDNMITRKVFRKIIIHLIIKTQDLLYI